MKLLLNRLLEWLLRCLLSLRYSIEIVGLDQISKEVGKNGRGVLILPNHPAAFIDPVVVMLAALKKIEIRPVVVEYMYFLPGVKFLMQRIDAVPIPNFGVTSNSNKVRRMNTALQEVIDGLKQGEAFLFYPAGKVKGGEKEQIGGASGLHHLIQEAPNVDIVLVRTTGLWGSRFSRAYTNKTPVGAEILKKGIWITLKNLIFFNPRRKVKVVFEIAPRDLSTLNRHEMNQSLEGWYNLEPDPINIVPYNRFGAEPKWTEEQLKARVISKKHEPVTPIIKQKIFAKLSELSDIPPHEIKEEMELASDLGLDSLDTADISSFLEESFDVMELSGEDLITVKDVLGFAIKEIIPVSEDEQPQNLGKWLKKNPSTKAVFPGGTTIVEVFLKKANAQGGRAIVADSISGILTYRDLKVRVAILREIFAKMPGESVGILLPASVTALVCFLACVAAKKVPIMINWTLGRRHIESVMRLTGMKKAITSWSFLDRLSNVDFGDLTDKLVQLEDLRKEITERKKLKAYLYSFLPTKWLVKKWGLDKVHRDDPAVVLFTSGSEGLPKGVPLSHYNILSNIEAVSSSIDLFQDDVMQSFLPPFHSFGLTVSTLAAPLLGLRASFYPNPNETHRIVKGIETYKGTILCGAPTFLKRILKNAKADEVKTLRLLVSGAEKAPIELFEIARILHLENTLIEGYGITECSPILTFNRPGERARGVGKPLKGVELDIIHPETRAKVSTGQIGLILARGPNVFSGYLNPSQASPFITHDGKVWYQTGDLGYLDEEGYLTLVGRLKRFIKVGGEMISLASLEDVLSETFPNGEGGPAFAVAAKEGGADRPRLILFTTKPLTLDEANGVLRKGGFSNLARFSLVYQLPDIPILGTGKIDYKKLEGEFLE